MVEKKIDSLEILNDIAGRLGYKLVKRREEPNLITLPDLDKEYSKMSVKEILVEIKDTELKIKAFEERDNKIRSYVTSFINKQNNKPEQLNKVLLNGKLDDRKLVVNNKEIILLRKLKTHLESLLDGKMVNELADHFLIEYREFGSVIKDIRIENTTFGETLNVELKDGNIQSDSKAKQA